MTRRREPGPRGAFTLIPMADSSSTLQPGDDLAPDILQFQQRLAAAYAQHPPLASVDLPEARRIVERVRAPLTAGGPAMARTEEHCIVMPQQVTPLRLRIHRPTLDTDLPALIYLHGGGWVFFSLDTHDRLMREYAARSGRVVIGVDYALAPEARFPVALQQCTAAARWVAAQAEALGLQPGRIAIGGDSVGANLALATALELREAADAPLEALLLNYGVYSDDDASDSFQRYDGPRYVLGRDEMRGFWQHYLRSDADRQDPRAQPLRAELHGLPPCCLVVAECDVLRDSSLALAQRLHAAGVPLSLNRYAGASHSFLEAMSFSALSKRALDDSCAWLRQPQGDSPSC